MEPELSKFTIEVLDHLSPTEWRTANQVVDGIAATWAKQGRRKIISAIVGLFAPVIAEEIIRKPNHGSVYVAFAQLQAHGLIDERWRPEPPEATAARNGHRLRERKLTENGHRVKALHSKTSDVEEHASAPKLA